MNKMHEAGFHGGRPVSDLHDESDSLLLLPKVNSLTEDEAEELGCYWMSTEGIPEFNAIPVGERKPDVFAVVKKWENDGFVSSYIMTTMVREVDYFLLSVCNETFADDGVKRVTPTSEEYGRNMLKVLSYMVSTGEYTKGDEKLDWLFDVLSYVLIDAAIRESGDPTIPVSLNTVGDVRRIAGVTTYVADVFETTGFDDNPYMFIEDESGMRIRLSDLCLH